MLSLFFFLSFAQVGTVCRPAMMQFFFIFLFMRISPFLYCHSLCFVCVCVGIVFREIFSVSFMSLLIGSLFDTGDTPFTINLFGGNSTDETLPVAHTCCYVLSASVHLRVTITHLISLFSLSLSLFSVSVTPYYYYSRTLCLTPLF